MGRAGSRQFTIPTRGRHGAPSHPRRHLTATRPALQRPPGPRHHPKPRPQSQPGRPHLPPLVESGVAFSPTSAGGRRSRPVLPTQHVPGPQTRNTSRVRMCAPVCGSPIAPSSTTRVPHSINPTTDLCLIGTRLGDARGHCGFRTEKGMLVRPGRRGVRRRPRRPHLDQTPRRTRPTCRPEPRRLRHARAQRATGRRPLRLCRGQNYAALADGGRAGSSRRDRRVRGSREPGT
jgi:hypothetical protein